MCDDKNFSTGSMLAAFVVGGLVGAGIALLTAPQSGKETREKIKDYTDEAKDKIKNAADDAKAKIADALRTGRDMVEDKKNLVGAAIEAGKKAMEEEKQKLSHG